MIDTTDYQSAYQLAAALNLGLAAFRNIRNPLQQKILTYTEELRARCATTQSAWEKKMRTIEEAAGKAAIAAGKTMIEMPDYLDHKKHSQITDLMIEASANSVEADLVHLELIEKSATWENTDSMLEKGSYVAIWVALAGLGLTTYWPQITIASPLEFMENYINWGLIGLSAAVYIPLLCSLALGPIAKSQLEKISRIRMRQIFKNDMFLSAKLRSM